MSVRAALPASGLAVAVGVGNASTLSDLSASIEELKASMPAKSSHETNQDVNLFGSIGSIGSKSTEDPGLEALLKRVSDLDHDMSTVRGRGVEAGVMSSNIDGISKELDGLDKSVMGPAVDVELLSGIASPAGDFVEKWDSLSTKVRVSKKDASILQIKDCNLGFMKNRGNKSSIRFAGVDEPNWSMYASAPIGKSTDDMPPSSHSGVTNNAIRVRMGRNSSDSVIVETPRKSLLHVGSDGRTNIMSTSSGDLAGVAGFSHRNLYNRSDFAVCQDEEGSTRINSKSGTDLILSSNGNPLVTIKSSPSKTMEIGNPDGPNTTFNSGGRNTIHSASRTRVRSGVSDTDRLLVDSQGVSVNGALFVDDVSVNEMIRALKFRLSLAEKKWR